MKILVFGGSGFLGSHTADALSKARHQVTVFDRRPSPYLQKEQRFILGDIQKSSDVRRALRGHKIAFNFAGFSNLEEAQSHPLETIQSNILGNGIILEECRKAKVLRYLFASTVYVYSDAASYYRASKLACEAYIDVYQRIHRMDCTILRFGSLFGPRASAGNGIHGYLTSALNKGSIEYNGTGEESREYIYVEDAARCCVDALKPEYKNSCLLVTGLQSMKIRDLFAMIKEILKRPIKGQFRVKRGEDLGDLHYKVTPYAFVPREARKLISTHYCDIGQGLLNVLKEIQNARVKPGKDS